MTYWCKSPHSLRDPRTTMPAILLCPLSPNATANHHSGTPEPPARLRTTLPPGKQSQLLCLSSPMEPAKATAQAFQALFLPFSPPRNQGIPVSWPSSPTNSTHCKLISTDTDRRFWPDHWPTKLLCPLCLMRCQTNAMLQVSSFSSFGVKEENAWVGTLGSTS